VFDRAKHRRRWYTGHRHARVVVARAIKPERRQHDPERTEETAMASYDGIVIGAGHNGLTLAAYLTRAGLKIAVLERNAVLGGGTSTAEPTLPGHRFNLHSNFFMGFGHAPLMRDLELQRFGFAYVEPPVQQAAAFRDGSCVVLHQDVEKSCASLARFSKRDAETFRELHELYAVKMRPLLVSLMYNAPLPIDALKDRLSGPEAKRFLSHAQHDLFSVVREYFDDDRIRTLFTSYMHVITTENVPGAGIVFPAIFANTSSFTLPVGGAVALPLALARIVEAGGGKVALNTEAREIVAEGGRATGVVLADGSRLAADRFVASAIDAPATMRMAGETLFPREVRDKLDSWHWGNHCLVTLHLALRDRPVYKARDFDPDIDRAFNIFFGMDDIDQVAQCFEHCAQGRFPDVLMGNGACNSQVDPTYAPAGGHSAFWWPFAPYAVDGDVENWARHKDDFAQRVLDVWREYASNLDDDNVRARFLFTPRDIERHCVNMHRGAVRMGAYVPSQLGINRPHPLLSGTRTPVEALYLCGSSTGNGGGINGAPGYIAANAIVDDLGLARDWTPVPPPEWRD
jgi:phytoene dehydrogenase-like protein